MRVRVLGASSRFVSSRILNARGNSGHCDRSARPGRTSATPRQPAEPAAVKPSLRSRPLSQPPTIDGVLDDDAWREGPLETGEWLSYNPLYGSTVPAENKGLDRPRHQLSLFRVPVRRPRPVRHQDLHHPPRQYLVRRLGGHQPRRARHRAALLSPDGQPQRRAARHAEHGVGRRRSVARLRVGQRRPQERTGLRRRDARAAPDDSLQGRSPTCTWGSSSGAG